MKPRKDSWFSIHIFLAFERIVALAEDEDMRSVGDVFGNTNDNMLKFLTVIREKQISLEPIFEMIVNERE